MALGLQLTCLGEHRSEPQNKEPLGLNNRAVLFESPNFRRQPQLLPQPAQALRRPS